MADELLDLRGALCKGGETWSRIAEVHDRCGRLLDSCRIDNAVALAEAVLKDGRREC